MLKALNVFIFLFSLKYQSVIDPVGFLHLQHNVALSVS